jgi:hypothetical protein
LVNKHLLRHRCDPFQYNSVTLELSFVQFILMFFQHYVLRGFETCEKANKPVRVAAMFFDIAKAFDTVSHTKLLRCLSFRYQLSVNVVNVLKSYLQGRIMNVRVCNSMSSSRQITSRVPQSSVLGPTLFLGFINAVSDSSLHESSKLLLFADDMTLLQTTENNTAIIDGACTVNINPQKSKSIFEFITPNLSKVVVLKHIPKVSRRFAADTFQDILNGVFTNNDMDSWKSCSPSDILRYW